MTPKQKKLLRQMDKFKKMRRSDFSLEELEILKFLMGQKYAKPRNTPDIQEQCYRITELGKLELYNNRNKLLTTWLPIAISLIALVKSFSTEILWLLQAIVKLLK